MLGVRNDRNKNQQNADIGRSIFLIFELHETDPGKLDAEDVLLGAFSND